MDNKIFICFAAEDRYRIVEPVVYHLRNYGINMWYDRYSLVMGDKRIEKNLIEGATECQYAILILSEFTNDSPCALEELAIIEKRYHEGEITVFPILYELAPNNLPINLHWVKELIFKEADRYSGTYEICNHIACKITSDILHYYKYQNIQNITNNLSNVLPPATYTILMNYKEIDADNINSRVALLYSAYITIKVISELPQTAIKNMLFHIFDRLFSETKLSLAIDYRELWLLENSICILVNLYIVYCIESKI